MSEPVFYSIVSVCFNNLSGLRRTHDSLRGQDFSGFEWIVADGGSVDGTRDYLSACPDARWVSRPDRGIYDAMNTGLGMAAGRYVIFMNAGDCFADGGVLRRIYDAVQSCSFSPEFIYGDSYEILAHGTARYKRARPASAVDRGMFTHHQAMMYAREAAVDIRYDLRYRIASDYDFTLRFLRKIPQHHILYVSEAVCLFQAGGVSQQCAEQGRREQFLVRRAAGGISVARNIFIYGGQFLALQMRRFAPFLYWFLKR